MSDRESVLKTVVILSACSLFAHVFAREVIRVREVANCPEDVLPTSMFDLSNVTLRVNSEGETLISGSGFIAKTETLEHGIVILKKCDSIEVAEEACEKMTEVPFKDICDFITQEEEMWSTILLKVKPKLECPLGGTYSVEDAVFDAKKAKQFIPMIGNSVMRLQFRCYVGDELKACGNMVGSVQTVISRGKKKKNKPAALIN